METVKEFLLPKSFNPFSFFMVVVTGIILLGVVVDIETNEQRYSFSCRLKGQDKEVLQRTCFADYQDKTTRGFPLYGFVLLYFLCVTFVAILYSLCVKTRIEEIESLDQQTRQASQSRRLYRSYCIQLAIRFSIGIVFLSLQWGVLYPVRFPSKHTCHSTHILQAKVVNATCGPGNTTGYWYSCYNPQAGSKTFWTIVVFTVIALLTFLILAELIFVVTKAKVSDCFKKDLEFFQIHLLNKSRIVRNQAGEISLVNNSGNVENYSDETTDNRSTAEGNAEDIMNNGSNFEGYVAKIKENIKEKTKFYEALLPDIPGEERQLLELDTIYTNLIMYLGRAEYNFSRTRHEIVEGYLKSQEQHESINKIEEIFAPNPEDPRERPLSIMIIGRPGIGKSLLCLKILRDWACGKAFNELTETGKRFEFVCLFKFRHFHSDETMNLQGLLGRGQFFRVFPQEAYDWILSHPEQVLLIFDGLDEFGEKEKIVREEPRFGNNHTKKMSFPALYAKLTLGNLLTGATVVTTSRPTALSYVSFPHPRKFDRILELLGFSYKEIEQYVTRFCQDLSDVYGKQIWNHIRSNGNLLSLCYIPVTCHILCFTFQERLKQGEGKDVDYLPTTLTEIYQDALIIIFCKHNPEYRCNVPEQGKLLSSFEFTPKVEDSLKRLGEVAHKGIENDKLVFESREVKGHEECGLLHRLPNEKVGTIQRKEQYCFLHLTLQEFLAAKYLVAQIKKRNREFESWMSDHLHQGKWEVVMQFVAGLSSDEDNSKITIIIDSLPRPTIGGLWPNETKLALQLFKYIFEISRNSNTGWKELIRDKLSGVISVDLSQAALTDADLTSIVFVLQEVKNITTLVINRNHITSIGCMEIQKLLKMSGSSNPTDYNCESKRITQDISANLIRVDGLQYLSEALTTNECRLTTLHISWNNISDDGLQYLSDALTTNECRLATLHISWNMIRDDGLKYLSRALTTNECRLTTLDISKNNISDDGLQYLSDALTTNECRLTTLDISINNISDDGLQYLSDALTTNECRLTTLHISWNKISDDGLQYLSDALTTNECRLTTLDISWNNISDDGLQYLSDALTTNECRLTTLNISVDNISDDGLQYLSDALTTNECKLTVLGIIGNIIPVNLLQYFSDALSSNECKLTTLNIRGTLVDPDLLKLLPDTLSILNIKVIDIDDNGLKHLCNALSSNECKLTTLNIYFDGIGEHVLKQLSDSLGNKECKITITKDIEENEIGADDVHLSAAVSSCEHKLTTLNVHVNTLGHH